MPRITEATNSPNKMIVSSPNLSGKCVAPGGKIVVLRSGNHVFDRSIRSATPQATYRYGAGKNAETAHTAAATAKPTIRLMTTDRVARNCATHRYCRARMARKPPDAAPNPDASLLLSEPVQFAAITATRNT